MKPRTVIMSSVCPRLTTHKTTNTIDAINANLVHHCDKSVTFIDNTPLFTLSDGSVNDGYIQRDVVNLTTTAINRVAKNLALKIICAEDGACGKARPPPPPTTRRSNHTNDDDIARRPQPRRSRHADNDEDGWQTVRRQPPRRGPTYCHFCGEGGHVKDNCRHGHKLECHACGQFGHNEKLCAHY